MHLEGVGGGEWGGRAGVRLVLICLYVFAEDVSIKLISNNLFRDDSNACHI